LKIANVISGVLCVAVSLGLGAKVSAQSSYTPLSTGMSITQNLGGTVPTDVPFLDEQGRKVTIGTYLGKTPVLVLPIFYRCRTGCAMIIDSLVQTLMKANQPTGFVGYMARKNNDHPLTPGRDLEIVMVGIDPRETPNLAADKKITILDTMDMRGKSGLSKLLAGPDNSLASETDDHLHLLTGTQANVLKVTDALGFKYYFNPATDVIRHPTGSVVLTPKGVISSYTIGNDFPTKMLEASLAIAAQNQVSEHKADQSFMFGCVILDPATGHIGFVVDNIVRVACVLTLLLFGFGIYRMMRNDQNKATLTGGGLNGLNRSN
jgi:protein SCO1/2